MSREAAITVEKTRRASWASMSLKGGTSEIGQIGRPLIKMGGMT